MKVAVVDDHDLFRKGVIELLRIDPQIQIVAEGASGDEAVEIARRQRPDVMLMDVEMPGVSVESALPAVLEASPGTAVLILTMHDDVTFVRRLIQGGAAGYLLKTIDHHELIAAVHAAARGDSGVRISVSRSTLAALTDVSHTPAQALSPREREVLQLVSRAHSNAEIAARLYVSPGTVKRHLTNIYAKLGASSRIDALLKARAGGLIEDPHPQG